jgi:CRP/FNR family cyclic AMP-dependent transcriptional regulator
VDRIDIFKDLDKAEMELLKPLFESLSCRAGTVVFQQGTPADFLYFIITGKVEMSFKPYDGTPITVAHVENGGLFGWSAVVGSENYTSSAIAIEEVKAFRVRGTELRKFCVEHPEAGKDILERLADGVSSRWKDAQRQVQSILLQGLKN